MSQHRKSLAIIDALNSSYWSERTEAIETLKKIDDPDIFLFIFKEIEKRNDNNLRFQLLVIFETLLQSNREEVCGVSIYALVQWKEKRNDALAAKSSKIIYEYIHSPQTLRYLKIKSVRFAWQKLPRSKRHTLTDVIGKNQLIELSRNLISNFLIRDERLWVKTIKILVRFRDKRVVKNVKKILLLDIKNDDLMVECINALGLLGSIWEYGTIKRYFKHPSLLVQVVAVRSFSRLTGNYGIGHLKTVIKSDLDEKVKIEAMTRLGRTNTKRSCRLLIELLLEGLKGDLGMHVNWALYDIDNKIKVPLLISSFFKTSDQGKMTIVNFLTAIYDKRIAPFILKVLVSNENEMIKIMVINLCSGYSTPQIISILEKYTLEFEGIISYTAMIELYEMNGLSNSIILETFFKKSLPVDSLCHQVVLKKLGNKNISESLMEYIPNYIDFFLSSKRNDLKLLVIDICPIYTSITIITKLIDMALHDSSENIAKASKRSLSKIVLNEPRYLSKMIMLFSDEYFISSIYDQDLTIPFVNELSILTSVSDINFSLRLKEKLSPYLEEVLNHHFEEINNIDSFFFMMMRCGVELSTLESEVLLHNVYSHISRENRIQFLEYLAYNPDSKYTDFFFNEIIAQKDLPHLLNLYMSNLSEVSND